MSRILWGNCRDMDRVFILQKKCIRAICSAHPLDSCKPLFKNLKVLSLPSLYIYEMACFAHCQRHTLTKYCDVCSFNTRNPNKIIVPPCRTEFCKRGCYHMLIKIYNKLPQSIKYLPLARFKVSLHKWLIKMCFYNVNEYLSLNKINMD